MVTKKRGGVTSDYILGIENTKINYLLDEFENLYNDVSDDIEYKILQNCLNSYINRFNFNYTVPIYTNNFIKMLHILDKLFNSFNYTKYNDYSDKQINNRLKCSSVFFLKLLNYYSNFYYNKNLQRNKSNPFINYKIYIFDPNVDKKNFNDKSFIANKLMMMQTYENKISKLDDSNKKESHETCFKVKDQKKLIEETNKEIKTQEINRNKEKTERREEIKKDIQIKQERKRQLLEKLEDIKDSKSSFKKVLRLIKESEIYDHTQGIEEYIKIYDDVSKIIIEKLNIESGLSLNPNLIVETLNIDESMNFIKNIIKNIKFIDTYIKTISPEDFFYDIDSRDYRIKYKYNENEKIYIIRSQIGIVDIYLQTLRRSDTEYYKNDKYEFEYKKTKGEINYIFGTIQKNIEKLQKIDTYRDIENQIDKVKTIITSQFKPTLTRLIDYNNRIYYDYVQVSYLNKDVIRRGGIKKKRKVKKMKKYV
jgi:hypothetical protein